MRHLRDVGDDGLARDVLTDTEGKLRLRSLELGTAEHIPEINGRTVLVRHLDADRRLARDRRLDTDIRRSETHLDIVCERHDLRHLHTDLRLQLIARDGRADGDVRNRDIDAEALQRFLERQRVLADLLSRIEVLTSRLLQEAERRDHVRLLWFLFLEDFLLYLRVIRIRRCIFLLLAIELGLDLLSDRLDIGVDHLTVRRHDAPCPLLHIAATDGGYAVATDTYLLVTRIGCGQRGVVAVLKRMRSRIHRILIACLQCSIRCMGVRIRRDPYIIRRLVERVICMSRTRIIYSAVHEVLVIPEAAADRKIFIDGLHLHARWFRI